MNNTADFVEDGFLAHCLGFPVIRLRVPGAAEHAIVHAAKFPRWMIEARVQVAEVATVGALQDRGFRLIDTNVQLVRAADAGGVPGGERCRMATAADEAAVRSVAATSFSYTRFHLDPAIPDSAANLVKEEWVGNFFRGKRGKWMVLAEDADGVTGFLQLLHIPEGDVVIDLIAVSERGRNKGVARSMIAYAASRCLERPATLLVGTQIANIASLALYDSLGFRISQASYVLHLHGGSAS